MRLRFQDIEAIFKYWKAKMNITEPKIGRISNQFSVSVYSRDNNFKNVIKVPFGDLGK
jgi:hypothetical protein